MATTVAFDKMPEVLYITRKHPPSIGGMQRLSFELRQSLSRLLCLHVIAWGYSQTWLPFFVVYAFFRAVIYLLIRQQIKIIIISDAVLAPLALLLKLIFNKKVVVTLHGLDIVYQNLFYQKFIIGSLRKLDAFVCNSQSTKDAAIKRGLPNACCFVVPIGVDPTRFTLTDSATTPVSEMLNTLKTNHNVILLTVGRLVKRKGVGWFIEHIFTDLVINHPDLCYLIVGDGPQRSEIETIIQRLDLTDKIWLCGEVSEQDLPHIYRVADIFVMPNISVEDDMEGFGIVALEAAVNNVCVVASKLEGIEDAITDQQNGWLAPTGDIEAFQKIIERLILDETFRTKFSRQAQEMTLTNFSWTNIAALHVEIIKKVATSNVTQSVQ